MDWEEFLDLENEWANTQKFGPMQTHAYWAARTRRVAKLKEEIGAGTYFIPSFLVAECIVMGRPKWGEALIDEEGNRKDEWWKPSNSE